MHTWTDEVHIPENLTQLVTRLKEVNVTLLLFIVNNKALILQILSIRTIHKQIVRLLTNAEQIDLKTNDMFKPFKNLDLLNYNSHRIEQFLAAKKLFEYLLKPAEEKVALKLKKQLSSIDANIRQVRCAHSFFALL